MTSPVPFYGLVLAAFIATDVLFWLRFHADRTRRGTWPMLALLGMIPVGGALGVLMVMWFYHYDGTGGINYRAGIPVGALMLLTILLILGIELRKGARDQRNAGAG